MDECATNLTGTLPIDFWQRMDYIGRVDKEPPIIMSNQANIELLETIFEEVQEAFPYFDEEKQIEIANNRFWEMAQ